MSDTLADLSSWLPSDFLSGDMDDKPLFLPTHHRPPYDFASTSSTESESDDDDVTIPGLTRRFTRSFSLQERLKNPYTVEKKRVFSGSPESTLNWNACVPTQTTSFRQANEDPWELIYSAKMKMNNVNSNGVVFGNRGLLGAPRPVGPTFSHNDRTCAMLRREKEEFLRQQLLRERVSGGVNYGGAGRFVAGRPVGAGVSVGQSAWPPFVETQRRQQVVSGFVVKPHVGSNGVCDRAVAVKKGCAGTGVFLPRNYSNAPPEPMKKPAFSAPARVNQPQCFNHPIISKHQTNMNVMFSQQQNKVPPLQNHHKELAEMILAQAHRQKAVMLAQQRRNMIDHESVASVPEARIGQSEVVLPQEWTY